MNKDKILNMTFKDICTILNVNAPLHFTSQDQLNRKNYVSCRYMGNAEKEARENGIYDSSLVYDDSDVGLHFPDMDIFKYFDLEQGRNPMAIEVFLEEFCKNRSITLKEIPVIWAVQSVLHEYGHWLDYKDSGKTPIEFSMEEKSMRASADKEVDRIRVMPDWDPDKMQAAKKYHKEIYMQIPSEKAANTYADKHIEKALESIRNEYGYTEDDMMQWGLEE